VMGHAILERTLLVGTRSADHIRASSHSGCIAMEVTPPFENRPDTWLHPNASQNVRFLLHRGRRPYMALSCRAYGRLSRPLSGVKQPRPPSADAAVNDPMRTWWRIFAVQIAPSETYFTGRKSLL